MSAHIRCPVCARNIKPRLRWQWDIRANYLTVSRHKGTRQESGGDSSWCKGSGAVVGIKGVAP